MQIHESYFSTSQSSASGSTHLAHSAEVLAKLYMFHKAKCVVAPAPNSARAAWQAYVWFLWIHQFCVAGGVMGYGILVLSFMTAPVQAAAVLGPLGLMCSWYCLYFGVLNRDCAEVAANRMVCALHLRFGLLAARSPLLDLASGFPC